MTEIIWGSTKKPIASQVLAEHIEAGFPAEGVLYVGYLHAQHPDWKIAVTFNTRSLTRPGLWVTYAIHDPTQPDQIEGRPEGLIRYVGQSKQFATRVRDRMKTAGRAMKHPTDKIDGLLYDIMRHGPAPQWTVLEEVHSAIESLVSETNWTIRLRAKGYPLVNQWTEHRLGTLEIDRFAVDHKRLWPITTADAVGSNIDVIVRDLVSGEEILVDLSLFRPTTRLQEIRADARSRGRSARLIVR